MGSIEVPIDREYPDKVTVRVGYIPSDFYGRGWPSK
jgi:hypothetical protein